MNLKLVRKQSSTTTSKDLSIGSKHIVIEKTWFKDTVDLMGVEYKGHAYYSATQRLHNIRRLVSRSFWGGVIWI